MNFFFPDFNKIKNPPTLSKTQFGAYKQKFAGDLYNLLNKAINTILQVYNLFFYDITFISFHHPYNLVFQLFLKHAIHQFTGHFVISS